MAVERSGLRVGYNKGFRTTPIEKKAPVQKSKDKKQFVKSVVREVAGFAPYERHILELLKVGTAATHKRALKFAKKRLGTHHRAKKKRAEMEAAYSAMRKAQKVDEKKEEK